MILSTLFAITMSALHLGVGAPSPSIASASRPLLCNFAKVYRLKPGSYLAVRSDWKFNSPIVDRIETGKDVYVCDSAMNEAGHHSYQIYYSGAGAPCKAATPNGLDEQKKRDCKSGWVSQKWVNLISG